MDKKIIAVMVTLVVVAALVVAFVMVAAGGGGVHKAGGFTSLFDKLVNPDPVNDTHDQRLEVPTSWEGDKITVSDTITDMSYTSAMVNGLRIYTTNLWFSYIGTEWNQEPSHGTFFSVPMANTWGGWGWLQVNHGLFMITISSATNISADYHAGEVISLSSTVSLVDGTMCFSVWTVENTL